MDLPQSAQTQSPCQYSLSSSTTFLAADKIVIFVGKVTFDGSIFNERLTMALDWGASKKEATELRKKRKKAERTLILVNE